MGQHLENKQLVTDGSKELIENLCVRRLSCRPYICSPFSVVSNLEGKLHLILNLQHLKQLLRKDKFKCEDVHVCMLQY